MKATQDTNKTVPLVYMRDFEKQLELAIKGNKKAIEYIDSLTIDRADGMGFDMFSKTSFWSDKISVSSSICAIVSHIYNRYKLFRSLQK